MLMDAFDRCVTRQGSGEPAQCWMHHSAIVSECLGIFFLCGGGPPRMPELASAESMDIEMNVYRLANVVFWWGPEGFETPTKGL